MHNELKKISTVHQPNSVVYSNENGNISDWLDTDPIIQSLKQQNEFIGSVPTELIGTVPEIPSGEDLQDYLSQYVQTIEGRLPQLYDEVHVEDVNKIYVFNNSSLWVETNSTNWQPILAQFIVSTVSRQPRNGDEVTLQAESELWLYNGTSWVFFTTTSLKDATTISKGVVQVGSGLNVSSGILSLDSSMVTSSRTTITSTETTPSLSIQANTDYIFSNALTSLTITQIESSFYHTSISFTTNSSFTFNSSVLTNWYNYSSAPTFTANTSYRIIISNGIGFLFILNSDIHLTKTEAATTYISTTQKGASGGVATLDTDTLIPVSQIPIDGTTIVASGGVLKAAGGGAPSIDWFTNKSGSSFDTGISGLDSKTDLVYKNGLLLEEVSNGSLAKWFTGASGAYLQLTNTINLTDATSWEVQTVYKYNGGGSEPMVFASGTGDFCGIIFLVRSGELQAYLKTADYSDWQTPNIPMGITMVMDEIYYFKFGYNTVDGFYLDYYMESGTHTYTRIWNNTDQYGNTISGHIYSNDNFQFLNWGLNYSNYYSSGSINWLKTKILVNGNTVFDGSSATTSAYSNNSCTETTNGEYSVSGSVITFVDPLISTDKIAVEVFG